ncbi:nuclease-related domain-containing protein [Clostridium sp. 1001275B_160808_H3]|uniref:nuclease-related domain-containing protein n=1 Tax=Clostridium sp. 1001275B_160808_H3 TaxID=2787110 RepID=UPI00189A3EAB|nr:nuclease-related domain-containing protein [Clostridium sp. 1001275B_160808_H3]
MNTQRIIITILLVLVIAAILVKKIKSKRELNLGEKEVNQVLSKLSGYKLLSDILIKREKGSSQIDHILIGKKGIFVIETKDYSGSIYGDQYSKYWIQIINRNKNQFYNPIRQNYGHIKALEEYIGRKGVFISVIVFTNKSKLKKVKTETPVIQLKKLKKFIRKYPSNIRLSREEIDCIYNSIKKGNVHSNRARKKHVKRITRNIS